MDGERKAITASGTGIAAFGDVLITATLYFYIGSSRTGMRQTEGVISRLCNYVLARGLLILICHVLTFITFIVSDNAFTCLLFHQQLSKLYCLTLFSLLLSFEPFRLASRVQHETGPFDDALSSRILLKVECETDSDGYVKPSSVRDSSRIMFPHATGPHAVTQILDHCDQQRPFAV
ncbi:hypothetical protein PUNSTDRAFT_143769 [Punctularia strigosozonata HHB-11173 SS5]|uniref:uncharacterized protein n=1 Tax=Punctularia strigosozonata (strain HHB-11173) TaxID=741275 RepID=UPI00044168C8|nr:uncharacterized protein PUNSTDRAFT_143769 [Punctularia strigosozonata HHB-11173 SS5]EIN09263.1 hypothetical protein PUNSTDRAFT_143769 [Punctularia strigosozonata HHB-11173 SS5]